MEAEEEKRYKLKLDDDDGTPKFGDKGKPPQTFNEVNTTPFEQPRKRVVT
jgi:hypothetical protein